jgi:hypothetical protein
MRKFRYACNFIFLIEIQNVQNKGPCNIHIFLVFMVKECINYKGCCLEAGF